MIKPHTLLTLFSAFFITAHAQVTISGVINTCTPVDSIYECDNAVYVESAIDFTVGDRVLLIQMKGATATIINNATFGNISNYNNIGHYEFATIQEISGSEIQFENTISRSYTFSDKVQLVKVPHYATVYVSGLLTAPVWNGQTGGVLAFEADSVILNADIDVSGKGFSGASYINYPDACGFGLAFTGYYTDTTTSLGAKKGEGIAFSEAYYAAGRGKLANGGGGGDDHNSGGGGGGNGAVGGNGGERIASLFSCPGPDPGIGGVSLDHSNVENRLYLGGGGGAGHGNNGYGTIGKNGGGIIIINTSVLTGNGHNIIANGDSQTTNALGDGAGGGGAGGSILIAAQTATDLTLLALGGSGGNVTGLACTGPGGGGAGGVIRHTGAALWFSVLSDVSGGASGSTITVASPCYGSSNGATAGATGQVVPNLSLFESTNPFIHHFASAGNDTSICNGASVNLLASGGTVYSWSPSAYLDNDAIFNPISTPSSAVTYIVTVQNAKGCSDNDTITVSLLPPPPVNAGDDVSICAGGTVTMAASGGVAYTWSPALYLDNAFIAAPYCTPTEEITYIVTIENENGCINTDTVAVSIFSTEFVTVSSDTNVCPGQNVSLTAAGGVSYLWAPSVYLDDATSATPICAPLDDISYSITAQNADGCLDVDTVTISLYDGVAAIAGPDTSICFGDVLKMHASGGIYYDWSPNTYLDIADVANPNCFATASITYIVTITDDNGCVGYDTVDVDVNTLPELVASADTTICLGDVALLTVSGASSYLWTPAAGIPCVDCSEITVSPSETTLYIVKGYNDAGCESVDSVLVTVQVCQSVHTILSSDILFYPNPANDYIYIGLQNSGVATQAGLWTISIINVQGASVYFTTIHPNEKISISNLPSGVYEMAVKIAGYKTLYKPLIISR